MMVQKRFMASSFVEYQARVNHDYTPDNNSEDAPCIQGEIVTVTFDNKQGWCYFRNSNAKEGWVPSDYLEKQEENSTSGISTSEIIAPSAQGQTSAQIKMLAIAQAKSQKKETKVSSLRTGNFLYVPLYEILELEGAEVPTFFWNATNFVENRGISY
jgi:hypothetical protein